MKKFLDYLNENFYSGPTFEQTEKIWDQIIYTYNKKNIFFNKKTSQKKYPIKFNKLNTVILLIINIKKGIKYNCNAEAEFWLSDIDHKVIVNLTIPNNFDINIYKNQIISTISHEIAHILLMLKVDPMKHNLTRIIKDKYDKFNVHSKEDSRNILYRHQAEEWNSDISGLIWLYNNLSKEQKNNLTLKDLVLLFWADKKDNKDFKYLEKAYGETSIYWRNKLLKTLAKEGIILRKSGWV